MSDTSSPGLYDEIMAMVPRMQAALAEIEERRAALLEAHRVALAEIDQEERRYRHLLKDLGVEEPKRRTKNQPGNKAQPSKKVMAQLLEAILAQGNDRFTALGIHQLLGSPWSEPHTYSSFSRLRELEIIGIAGKEDRPNGRKFWRILPGGRELAESIIQETEAKTNGRTPVNA